MITSPVVLTVAIEVLLLLKVIGQVGVEAIGVEEVL